MLLVYCADEDRWQTHGENPMVWTFRCGDKFAIRVDKFFLPCRLELDREWYVIFENTRFYLHPRVQYEICTF